MHANGQPALAFYEYHEGEGALVPFALNVQLTEEPSGYALYQSFEVGSTLLLALRSGCGVAARSGLLRIHCLGKVWQLARRRGSSG